MLKLVQNSGGTFARSAGTSVQIMAKTDEYATLKMPSGEIRIVTPWIVGLPSVLLGNADYKNIVLVKQVVSRHMGIRPTVRGMAMNPVDHPHGGGEGRSKSGSHPVKSMG